MTLAAFNFNKHSPMSRIILVLSNFRVNKTINSNFLGFNQKFCFGLRSPLLYHIEGLLVKPVMCLRNLDFNLKVLKIAIFFLMTVYETLMNLNFYK